MVKKFPLKWRDIEKIVRQNGIDIIEGKGSKKKLKKIMNGANRTSIIHAHNKNSEIEPWYVNQIIDKFNKDESEFF